MIRVAALALACAICTGCVLGVTTTVQPASLEGPIPPPFHADEAPVLAPTEIEGLSRAPSLAPNVYYHAPADLWYRRAYRRWYQAFRWNGNWFILAETPTVLVGREIERVALPELPELPTLPELPDDATALPELPELPEVPEDDGPDEAFEPP